MDVGNIKHAKTVDVTYLIMPYAATPVSQTVDGANGDMKAKPVRCIYCGCLSKNMICTYLKSVIAESALKVDVPCVGYRKVVKK